MTAANLDEILGPEPTEEQQAETPQEAVAETPVEQVEQPAEVAPIENKQTPEQIAENYKRMAHAERMERKQIAEQMKVMQQRFEQLMQALPKQETAPEPDYVDDPLGATFTKVDKVAQSVEELKKEAAQRQQVEQYQSFVQSVQADENSFMQKTPDYKEAVSYIQSRRASELKAMGYDDNVIMRTLAQDAQAVVMRAQELGESPAAFVYNMAKQVGYSPKQNNIETIAAGQQVAKSVSGGAQPVSEGSLPQNLAEMTDAEFDALFKQMSKS